MSANEPKISIRIVNSVFQGNGACQPNCARRIHAGHIKMGRVEGSRFLNQHEGHHIKERAERTEVVDCDIQDGPTGTYSYLIDIANGGSVLIEKNKMSKGRMTSNGGTAISIGAEGDTNPSGPIVVRNNNFVNQQERGTVFVRDFAATAGAAYRQCPGRSGYSAGGRGNGSVSRPAAQRAAFVNNQNY